MGNPFLSWTLSNWRGQAPAVWVDEAVQHDPDGSEGTLRLRSSLAAMSQTVDRPVAPIRIPRGSAELKALTRVIWRSRIVLGAPGVADDIAELDSDDAIGLPVDACVFEVGISAEPQALDGHSVIAGAWADGMAMLDLEGRIVIAACEGEDDTEQFYLKHVHFDGETARLVNLNPDHGSLPAPAPA